MKIVTHVNDTTPEGKAFMVKLDQLDGLLWRSGNKPSGCSYGDSWLYFGRRDDNRLDRSSPREGIEDGFTYFSNNQFFQQLSQLYPPKPQEPGIATHINPDNDQSFLKSLDQLDGLKWNGTRNKPSEGSRRDGCYFLIFNSANIPTLSWGNIEEIAYPIVSHDDFFKACKEKFPPKVFNPKDFLGKEIFIRLDTNSDRKQFLKLLESRYPRLRWASGDKPSQYLYSNVFLHYSVQYGKKLYQCSGMTATPDLTLTEGQFIAVLDLYPELKKLPKPTWLEYLEVVASINTKAALVLATSTTASRDFNKQDEIPTVSSLIVFADNPQLTTNEWWDLHTEVRERYEK